MRLDFAKVHRPPEQHHCPVCRRLCRVFFVRKDGPRKGFSFIKCRGCEPNDGRFYWVRCLTAYTDEQKRAIERDLRILLGECDGACARDDVGFNGTDAGPARRFADDLNNGLEIDWNKLASMLRKYRRTQLGGHDEY